MYFFREMRTQIGSHFVIMLKLSPLISICSAMIFKEKIIILVELKSN